MSIYGAMFSGVSGLAAQSQALGMISNNISNVNTIGYKATKARFSTLITSNPTATSYAPGGVQASPFAMIDRQGLLQASDSETDIAVSGNGFFIVNESANPGIGDSYLFTRAGSFNPDKSGNLRNTAGFFLQGWRLDASGNLAAGINPNVLTGTETINVSNLTGSVKSTENITIAANLPADATIVAAAATTTATLTGNVGRSSTLPNSATQTMTLYDDLGAPYSVTLTYTQTAVGVSGGADVGWNMQVTGITDPTGTNALTAAHVPVALTYNFDTGALTSASPVAVDFNALTTGPIFNAGGSVSYNLAATVSTTSGTTLSASLDGSTSLAYASLSDSYPLSVQVFDSLGVGYNVAYRFVKSGVTTGSPQTSTSA